MESNHAAQPKIPYIAQLLIVVGLFLLLGAVFNIIGAFIAQAIYGFSDVMGFATSIERQAEYPTAFLILRGFEALGAFIIPALFFPFTIDEKPKNYYNLKSNLLPFLILIVIGISYTMGPLVNLSAQLNDQLVLPDYFRMVEDWLAEQNQQVQEIYDILLDIRDPGTFILVLVVAAVIPAIGEELIFRGALQNIFGRWTRNPQLGIWLSAILFSAIHLQVYLFLPRLLLGALFGYLVYWSRNLWYPIIAHFLNNAFVVVAAYYLHMQGKKVNMDDVGDFPLSVSVFFILILIGLIYIFRKRALKERAEDAGEQQLD